MKLKSVVSLLMMILLTTIGSITYAQSQAQMNAKAGASYLKADKELNQVYQKILKEYASQPVFIRNLKTAQKLWIQLRNADLNAKFPEPGTYGSVEPMCKAEYLEKITKDRIRLLKVWLDRVPEGNICGGSVKIK